MWKIRKWFERHSADKKEYEEDKREFGMAIGKPFITLKVEMPVGFENQRSEFLDLESDVEFIGEIEDLIKKNLTIKRKNLQTLSEKDE
jgi:hypothetical protein